jgi:glycosylphosphatidylinositol transamidase
VTPYKFGKSGAAETLSLSIAYTVFSLLSRVTWLAKDIIWFVADSQYGEYAPVEAWLRDYHTPVFTGLGTLKADTCVKIDDLYVFEQKSIAQRKISDGFRRAGTMAAALILKVADRNELLEDTLNIYAEASNGQMPNLDLINIVNYLAVHRQGLRVKVEKVLTLLDSRWLEILGEMFELLGKVARSLNPGWKFGISAADYIEGSATLASSLYYQVLYSFT